MARQMATKLTSPLNAFQCSGREVIDDVVVQLAGLSVKRQHERVKDFVGSLVHRGLVGVVNQLAQFGFKFRDVHGGSLPLNQCAATGEYSRLTSRHGALLTYSASQLLRSDSHRQKKRPGFIPASCYGWFACGAIIAGVVASQEPRLPLPDCLQLVVLVPRRFPARVMHAAVVVL